MKIGLTYTVRSESGAIANGATSAHQFQSGFSLAGARDDVEEEFDSPETIAAIASALSSLGHEVELLGDGPPLARRLLDGAPPDFVFNIAEGRGIGRSREAWVPAILEMFGVPYSGSDPLTLAAALDKHWAKRLVQEAGVAAPVGVLVDGNVHDFAEQLAALSLPLIVKPAYEGSSKGIGCHGVVDEFDRLPEIVENCCAVYHQPALVEEFIEGDELTVGILGNNQPEVVGVMRVLPKDPRSRFVYGLEVKRDWRRQVRYEIPAQLNAADDCAVRQAALRAFSALGCRDVARIDFRLRHGVPYFLEANPLPGLAPGSSDLVLLAEGVGIGYVELIGRIVDAAQARIGNNRDEDVETCANSSAHQSESPLHFARSMS